MDARSRFPIEPNVQTHFAWLRTRMSAERTLMSWVRTGAALIGFGFTMEGVAPAMRPGAPRYLGLALIGAGILGLIVASWEYRSFTGYLWSRQFESVAGVDNAPWHMPTLWSAVVLILIGIFAFGAVLLRFS